MSEYSTVLGGTLRKIRKLQQRTLRSVAAESHVALGYLSEVEVGSKEPSAATLYAVCSGLNIELWWLLQQVSIELHNTTKGEPHVTRQLISK